MQFEGRMRLILESIKNKELMTNSKKSIKISEDILFDDTCERTLLRNDRSFSFKSHLFMLIGSKLPSMFCFKSGRNTVSLALFLMLTLALWSALSA